jgi:hypothetical protein
MNLGSRPLGKKDSKSILKELKGDIKSKKDRKELIKGARELYEKYK